MIDTVEVRLWGTRIGILYRQDARRAVSFEYEKNFLKSGIELSPFMMPLSDKVYYFPELPQESFHGLPGMIADSVPDKFGNAVIRKWLASKSRTADSFSVLEQLCYTGKRGMGALEYVPSIGSFSEEDSIDVTEMAEFASQILNDRKQVSSSEKDMNMARMMEIGTSAGGARAKALIAWNRKTGEIRSGQVDSGRDFDYYLLKFDGVSGNGDHEITDPKQYTLIEFAYYQMAKDLGIKMNECAVYKKNGLNHFITKRFDRVDGEKLHMQTFAALSHSDFNYPGSTGYEMLADYSRQLGLGQEDIRQIYMRMVFNVMGMNCDDHVKNFSFLMDRTGKWSLAPAYDITYAYSPGNRWLSGHQMTVNGKTFNITEEDMLTCGKTMGLNTVFCKSVLEKTRAVVDNWSDYAMENGISEERMQEVADAMESGYEV